MSLDGTEFVALDSAVAAPDEHLDAFLEWALNSNVEALWELGDQISWTPRCASASNLSASDGHRPYASMAWSSILNVPWMCAAGTDSIRAHMLARCSDEHGENLISRVRMSLVGVGEVLTGIGDTSSMAPEHQDFTLDLEFEPLESGLTTDLRLEHESGVGTTDIDSDEWSQKREHLLIGRVGGVVAGQSGTLPNATDQHLQVFYDKDADLYHDCLHSDDSWERAYVRGVSGSWADEVPAGEGVTRALSYLQVRGVELVQSVKGARVVHPRTRFEPLEAIDARDTSSHALDLSTYHQRPRCLWIGPVGELGGEEEYHAGYGRRFRVLDGAETEQDWITASVRPRTSAPVLRVMINVMGVWLDSGFEYLTFLPEKFAEAAGRASWDFTLTARRWTPGGLDVVASAVSERNVIHYPVASTLASTLAFGEFIHEGRGYATIPRRYHKEGQLFAEDYEWLQRLHFELELPDYDVNAHGDMPLLLTLGATPDGGSFDFPEPPDGVVGAVSPGASKLRLINTGSTVWEVPQ